MNSFPASQHRLIWLGQTELNSVSVGAYVYIIGRDFVKLSVNAFNLIQSIHEKKTSIYYKTSSEFLNYPEKSFKRNRRQSIFQSKQQGILQKLLSELSPKMSLIYGSPLNFFTYNYSYNWLHIFTKSVQYNFATK